MGFRNPIVGGTSLIRQAIKSPDYVVGSSGWTINKDGSAEFNDLTLRGQFNGNDFIMNTDGMFFYSGEPAAGNIAASAAPLAGADEFGNEYPVGFATYGLDLFDQPITSQVANGAVRFWQPGMEGFDPGGIGVTSLSGNDSFRLTANPPFSPDPSSDTPILEMYTSSASFDLTSEVQLSTAKFGLFTSNGVDFATWSIMGMDQGVGNVGFAARQTDTATTTTAEVVALTSPTVRFYPNRAYRVRVHGLVQSSVSGDCVSVRVRKGSTSGDTLLDSARLLVIPGASVQALCDLEVIVITNDSPPTDQLVMTFYRSSGSGTAVVRANANNPAYLAIHDIGAAGDYPGARLLS